MIRASVVLGLARAEMRITRRLVRYWIFVVIATLAGLLGYGQLFAIHRLFSAGSASAASTYPRFFIGNFGSNFLFLLALGLILLAFDIRARDRRDRILEVLDAKPFSNLELVFGKALGIAIPAWLAAVGVAALLQFVSFLLGTPVEPVSLVAFLVFMAIPAVVFCVGLVFLVTILVRHRFVAAVLSLLVMLLAFFVSIWWIPMVAVPFTDVTGGFSIKFPSDIIPGTVDLHGLLQRLGYLVVGFALLGFTAAWHPRGDAVARGRRAAIAAALLVLGVVLAGYSAWNMYGIQKDQRTFRAAHDERRGEAVPDIVALSGSVDVRPGSALSADLRLTIAAPPLAPLERALFTLNPGLHVSRVAAEGGAELTFRQADGLLDVTLPVALAPGERTTLAVEYEGRPDPAFAYLYATLDPLALVLSEAQIFILGFDSLIFDDRYIALLPGIRWLPMSGSESGRGDPEVQPEDFFDLDLSVELPAGWLAAGPGRRRESESPAAAGRVRYRWAPPAPLPGAALIAGRFESRAIEVGGVTLEMLIHPDHVANLDFFDDSAAEIRTWLEQRLTEAASSGLDYPYDGLTMVEIPNVLRGYAGGWRMDSTLIQPAMILMRESGFPTAHFKGAEGRLENSSDAEGGVPRAKRRMLEMFFENDLNGGNPFTAAGRSFFGFQTAGSGAAGLPLDYVFEQLSTQLISEKTGFFSVHFFDSDFGQEFVLAGQMMNDPNRVADSYAENLIHNITSTPEVWETITSVSLARLRPEENPERAISALSLKGGAMAESLFDELGRERTGQFLSTLRDSHRGTTYSREDVVAAGESAGEDLGDWIDLWVEQTELPGFTAEQVQYRRISDAGDGTARYQLVATLRNGEEVPGLLRLEYRTSAMGSTAPRHASEPIRIAGRSAVEVGLVTSEPLQSVRVAPYLALNRDPFNLVLPSLDEQRIVDAEPFDGSRPVEWVTDDGGAIVVDDLDDGFSVSEAVSDSWLAGLRGGGERVLDRGLPITSLSVRTSKWSRMTYSDAFGRYRRTMAVVRAGEGLRSATFEAELPHAGSWELSYYVPQYTSRFGQQGGNLGTWKLRVEDGSGSRDLTLDADAAQRGWNSLGALEMAAGTVMVVLSDETDGRFVQADAVRWVPARPAPVDEVASITDAQ